jgi:hypothetical protein
MREADTLTSTLERKRLVQPEPQYLQTLLGDFTQPRRVKRKKRTLFRMWERTPGTCTAHSAELDAVCTAGEGHGGLHECVREALSELDGRPTGRAGESVFFA